MTYDWQKYILSRILHILSPYLCQDLPRNDNDLYGLERYVAHDPVNKSHALALYLPGQEEEEDRHHKDTSQNTKSGCHCDARTAVQAF